MGNEGDNNEEYIGFFFFFFALETQEAAFGVWVKSWKCREGKFA